MLDEAVGGDFFGVLSCLVDVPFGRFVEGL
jgi:hypothetical protein